MPQNLLQYIVSKKSLNKAKIQLISVQKITKNQLT